jgi:hypothetical protein
MSPGWEINVFIEAIQDWVESSRHMLNERRITVGLSEPTRGPGKNSIHAELRGESSEATVEVWDTGESDFHFADMGATSGVVVTHHDFRSREELENALDDLANRLS